MLLSPLYFVLETWYNLAFKCLSQAIWKLDRLSALRLLSPQKHLEIEGGGDRSNGRTLSLIPSSSGLPQLQYPYVWEQPWLLCLPMHYQHKQHQD